MLNRYGKPRPGRAPLLRCFCNNHLLKQFGVIRVVEPEFVTGACTDPIRHLRITRRISEQHFVPSILRDVDLTRARVNRPLRALEINRSNTSCFSEAEGALTMIYHQPVLSCACCIYVKPRSLQEGSKVAIRSSNVGNFSVGTAGSLYAARCSFGDLLSGVPICVRPPRIDLSQPSSEQIIRRLS
jgi:hypothetical protein